MEGNKQRRHKSQGEKTDQPDGAIWHFCQKRGRGLKVTPHSLILSRFPLLLSFLLLFSYSFFLLSFFSPVMLLHCVISRRWAPWPPASFLQVELRFLLVIAFCLVFFTRFAFTYVSSFFLFCLRIHASDSASVAVALPPPLWRPRITGHWCCGEGAPPSVVVP